MAKLLLSIHVLAAILLIGRVTIAGSLFPRFARQALAAGPERQPAKGSVRLLHRICRVYAVAGVSVPAFGIGTAEVMGVMGSTRLIVSRALTAVAAVLLGIVVLGTQDDVVTQLDKPEQASAAAEALIARLPRLSMITGLLALAWLIVVVLMIVRPGSTAGASRLSHRSEPRALPITVDAVVHRCRRAPRPPRPRIRRHKKPRTAWC
ncbi:DUF2269 family protein [Streptomyces sp. AK02-04a]|uniref:DUF2269 family protein n=1 Tax=Streptomyces sp. AK02-04a TaxID=3028649 RepID=UPI0029C9C433|nr:DUF2269 family protein [Streptomyces sp. AK02-04a]